MNIFLFFFNNFEFLLEVFIILFYLSSICSMKWALGFMFLCRSYTSFWKESIELFLHIKARYSSCRNNKRAHLVKLSKTASYFIKDHRVPTGKKGFLLLKDINEDMKEKYNLKIIIKMMNGWLSLPEVCKVLDSCKLTN